MKFTETETHHNQGLTVGAAGRSGPCQKATKKIVALQLNEKEYAALRYLGGVDGLKALLCPVGLCINCRKKPSFTGSSLDSLCEACNIKAC